MPNVNLLFCQYVKKTKNLTIQARNNQQIWSSQNSGSIFNSNQDLEAKKNPARAGFFRFFSSITDWLFVRFKRGAQDIAQRRP